MLPRRWKRSGAEPKRKRALASLLMLASNHDSRGGRASNRARVCVFRFCSERGMDRRTFLAGVARGMVSHGKRAPQHVMQEPSAPLPPAPSSPEPFASLRGGGPHHLTPAEEAQR